MADFLNLLSDTTFSEKMDIQNRLLAAIASKSESVLPKSFADVQSIVRMGLAPMVFAIGDQFVCNRGDEQLIWDVIGFDMEKPRDILRTHSMTLQLHTVMKAGVPFSCRYANYYTKKELPAGTYWFYDTLAGKARHFTSTAAVAAGAQLCVSDDVQNPAMVVYTSGNAGASYALTDGEEGTQFDTLTDTLLINEHPENRDGKNTWLKSNVYRWLNTPQDTRNGSYWRLHVNKLEISKWDTTSGFSDGLDPDFYAAVGCVDKGAPEDEIRFFLLSTEEVYGAPGKAYPYFSEHTSLVAPGFGDDPIRCRLMTDDILSVSWYLRSAPADSTTLIHIVNANGAVTTTKSYESLINKKLGICPACAII